MLKNSEVSINYFVLSRRYNLCMDLVVYLSVSIYFTLYLFTLCNQLCCSEIATDSENISS